MSESIPIPEDVLACPEGSYAATAWIKLRRLGAYMAARYNGPVYLVGSSLRTADPRDVDVRVIISDDEFKGRYGVDSHGWALHGPPQVWIDDMAKRNGELAAQHRLNGDFQVYPARHSMQFEGQPRVVLATPTGRNPVQEVIDHDNALSAAIARGNE